MLQEEVSPGRLWVLCKAALWLWTQDLRKVLHLPGTRSLSAHKDRVKTWPHFFCPVFSEVPSIRAHGSILPIPVIPSSLVRNAESKPWAVAEGHLLPGVHSSVGLCPVSATTWISMVHLVPCVLSTANETGGGKPEGGVPGRQKGSYLSPRALAVLSPACPEEHLHHTCTGRGTT